MAKPECLGILTEWRIPLRTVANIIPAYFRGQVDEAEDWAVSTDIQLFRLKEKNVIGEETYQSAKDRLEEIQRAVHRGVHFDDVSLMVEKLEGELLYPKLIDSIAKCECGCQKE